MQTSTLVACSAWRLSQGSWLKEFTEDRKLHTPTEDRLKEFTEDRTLHGRCSGFFVRRLGESSRVFWLFQGILIAIAIIIDFSFGDYESACISTETPNLRRIKDIFEALTQIYSNARLV